MKHVIIGSGAAGITAAKVLREQCENAEIVILSADEAVYSRCMLHHFVSGERQVEELSFISDGFFAEHRIRFCPNVQVTGIDTASQCVLFDGGSETYDRLLIATGSESFFPPIDGLSGTKQVYGLRDLSDARAIREQAKRAEHIVVIGAGLVGLDAAYGLVKMGKAPTVVDFAETILSANLDAHAAATYQAKFEEAGCRFYLDRKVTEVVRDGAGNVSAVTLDSGDTLPCDLLIVAVGVRPMIGFLQDSGIACGRGVMVNDHLATNVPGIYAAGDAAGLSESWPSAILQGEVAAMNMSGTKTTQQDTFSAKNTVHFFGIPALSAGRLVAGPGDVEDCREDRNRYQKVITHDGVPVGVILQGDISRSGFWQYLIKNNFDVTNIPKSIWNVSVADTYGLDENGEYQWDV